MSDIFARLDRDLGANPPTDEEMAEWNAAVQAQARKDGVR